MGGLTLNVIVGALLYEPVDQHKKWVKVRKEPTDPFDVGADDIRSNGDPLSTPIQEVDNNLETVINMKTNKNESDFEQPLLGELVRKMSTTGTGVVKKSNVSGNCRKVSSSSYGGRMVNGSSTHLSRKISAYASPTSIGSSTHISRNFSVASNMSSSSLRYVSTAFHGSTLVGFCSEFSSTPNVNTPSKKSQYSLFNCCQKPFSKNEVKKEKKVDEVKKPSVVKQLLTDPLFIVILISNASNAIGYVNFTILVPTYAINLGFDKARASYLLSVIATTDLIGRIGGAALSDVLKCDKRFYFVGGFLVSGVALCALPFVFTYKVIAALCALFGLASGTYVGITAVIMVDMLGEKFLASSYGISLFVNGILQLIGPPICGAIYQQINSYQQIIFGLGVVLVIGAAVWIFVPFFKKRTYE